MTLRVILFPRLREKDPGLARPWLGLEGRELPVAVARISVLVLGLALAFSGLLPLLQGRAAEGAPKVELLNNSVPRPLEDTTQKAVVKAYSEAWKALAVALEQNRASVLDDAFVGVARNQLAARIESQKKAGFRTRILDGGHKVEAIFYSPEGSAIQVRDTALLEAQVLDGDKVVFREEAPLNFIAVLTVIEADWKVRVLESAPEF